MDEFRRARVSLTDDELAAVAITNEHSLCKEKCGTVAQFFEYGV
jgi:hypothetical protein